MKLYVDFMLEIFKNLSLSIDNCIEILGNRGLNVFIRLIATVNAVDVKIQCGHSILLLNHVGYDLSGCPCVLATDMA